MKILIRKTLLIQPEDLRCIINEAVVDNYSTIDKIYTLYKKYKNEIDEEYMFFSYTGFKCKACTIKMGKRPTSETYPNSRLILGSLWSDRCIGYYCHNEYCLEEYEYISSFNDKMNLLDTDANGVKTCLDSIFNKILCMNDAVFYEHFRSIFFQNVSFIRYNLSFSGVFAFTTERIGNSYCKNAK